MVKINFVLPSDRTVSVEVPSGLSLMEGAMRHGIDGIAAECGGSLACATCHVHVADEWLARLPVPSDDEATMLEYVVDPDHSSRLSCQLTIDDELDGLTVRIPKSQK